ncbi:MarR family winged helix-turn-helix transcriptional regulator [Paenibacillus xanthanilyticus]|uniref:MarR family winged helix-turn-helix transcriptional regulator n=2 Tax=Paenibacillus xanthanilyticus TaxID=1783531 RepID=UPI003671079F
MQANARLLELPALFKCFMKKATQEWKETMEHDLSISQFRMLYALYAEGPGKSADLAVSLGVTPGAVTGLADRLMEKRYVTRTRDGQDRRVALLAITDEGRRFVEGIKNRQQDALETIFDRLNDEDIEHLCRIFTLLLDREPNASQANARAAE